MTKRAYLPDEPCICINLRRIALKMTDYYDMALKPTGVNINQYSLLVNIGRMEGCGIGELARRVRLEKSTLVRTLRPLLRDGLIVDKSEAEGRRRRLYLTAAAEEVLEKALPLWRKAQEDVAQKFGKNLDELMTFLEELVWRE